MSRTKVSPAVIGLSAAIAFTVTGVGTAVAATAAHQHASTTADSKATAVTVTKPVSSTAPAASTPTATSRHRYAKNASGKTFGSAAGVMSANDEPDLTLVVGNSGNTGYVYTSALDKASGDVQTLQQAAQWDKTGATQDHTIAVYASDGKTQIDTFTIGAADGQAGVPSAAK